MNIVLTGASGMVGSRFFDLLKGHHEITPLSSSFGVDVTDKTKVRRFLDSKNPAVIVHMAAKTNVDKCEEDKEADTKLLEKQTALAARHLNFENLKVDEWKESTSAFGINVIGTKNIADWAKERGRKIVYISTDFVFDGKSDDPYDEESKTGPINWYGQTKLWGEKTLSPDALITRISYPYGFRNPIKKDLVWIIVDLLSKMQLVELISDQVITPTFIDDIVYSIDNLISENISGTIDIVGNNYLSPYEIGIAVAREYDIPETKIATTTRSKLYRNRAPRPFKLKLKNDKLASLGYKMKDFYDVLKMIKK